MGFVEPEERREERGGERKGKREEGRMGKTWGEVSGAGRGGEKEKGGKKREGSCPDYPASWPPILCSGQETPPPTKLGRCSSQPVLGDSSGQGRSECFPSLTGFSQTSHAFPMPACLPHAQSLEGCWVPEQEQLSRITSQVHLESPRAPHPEWIAETSARLPALPI